MSVLCFCFQAYAVYLKWVVEDVYAASVRYVLLKVWLPYQFTNSVCLYSSESEMPVTEEICSFSKLMLEIAEFKMLLFYITLKMSHSSKTDILYT